MAKKSSDFPAPKSAAGNGDDSELDDLDPTDSSPDQQQDLVPDASDSNGDDEDEADDAEAAVVEKLQIFGASLAKRRDEWVRARASTGFDKRVIEDLDQYNGKDSANKMASSMMASVEQGYPVTTHGAKPTRSTVFVHMTRQKTNAAVARLDDATNPMEEPNFSVRPTPIPRLPSFVQVPGAAQTPVAAAAAQMVGGGSSTAAAHLPGAPSMSPGAMSGMTGAQATGGQAGAPTPSDSNPTAPSTGGTPPPAAAQPDPNDPDEIKRQAELAKMVVAKAKADAMQLEIEECFDECDFSGEQRKMQFWKGLFGTGVLKGPVAVKTTRKAWSQKTDAKGTPYWLLDVVEDLSPHSFAIDPRNVYPDPTCGDNVQNGRGIFEVEKKSPKQVRELAKQPEYIKSQLIQVLEEGPQVGKAFASVDIDENGADSLSEGEIFEHWIYWGEVEHEDLIAAGAIEPAKDGEEKPEDKLRVVSACVEMINSTVVRAYLNPLIDNELPYDMIPWERVPGSVWGLGIPYLMRAQQRVVNTAWRMILDNAGVSAGPQVVIRRQAITPADKKWEISSRKIWYANEDVEDVTKAFATFEFDMHLTELSKILEMAERLVDVETATPQIAQGSQTGAPNTVGVANQVMAGANVVLKRLVKINDDYGIKPHVRRYYNFLMEYSDKDEIKGDYQVMALGSSTLLMRDQEATELTNLLALAGNPAYSVFINKKKLFERALKSKGIDPTDVMNTDPEIESEQKAAAANQKPDPRIEVAGIVANTKKAEIQSAENIAQQTVAMKEQLAQSDREMRIQELSMERDIEILRASQKENVTVQQIKAQLAAVAITQRATTERQVMKHGHEAALAGLDPAAAPSNSAAMPNPSAIAAQAAATAPPVTPGNPVASLPQ